MKLGFLQESEIDQAIQAVLDDPYLNALMIADLTALKEMSTFVCAHDETGFRGLLSLYADIPAIALWCEDGNLARRMLAKMASHCRRLSEGSIWCLCGRKELSLLEKIVQVNSAREELQMRLDFSRFVLRAEVEEPLEIRSLSCDHIPDLNALYEVVPPEVWKPEEVNHGPYEGAFDGDRLVAAAGVHWVSPWIAEVGNVAVLPEYRRRGLAEACVGAVVEDLRKLTERIYLMVFADNEPAIQLYYKMGFAEIQRMWLVDFKLPAGRRMPRKRGQSSGVVG